MSIANFQHLAKHLNLYILDFFNKILETVCEIGLWVNKNLRAIFVLGFFSFKIDARG